MFDRIFSTGNKEEKKIQKIRTTERHKEEEFVRERDRFAAAMNDEAQTIHRNPELNDLTRWQQDKKNWGFFS